MGRIGTEKMSKSNCHF